MRKLKEISFSGFNTDQVQPYEVAHRAVARNAAAAGMVLLKNENQALPLKAKSKIALYGAGATRTVAGGTGSGDVNKREFVSVYQGLKNAGFEITTENWLKEYERLFQEKHLAWRDQIWALWEAAKDEPDAGGSNTFSIYSSHLFVAPEGELDISKEKIETETAIYVVRRTAGEDKDRRALPGDYYLSETEVKQIGDICQAYKDVILLLNTGGVMDLSILDQYENIKAVLLISQPGMEAGNAVADVLSGVVSPSGKLTDTWGFSYEDYPCADSFSHNGSLQVEDYREGIYVGYRYFDAYESQVRYSFGYGLSYTDFEIKTESFTYDEQKEQMEITLLVKNTGLAYSGQEIVQVYAACPQGEKISKEYRRLAGFAKTKVLLPGEEEILKVEIPVSYLTSYDEKLPGWVLDEGLYGIFVGNSLADAKFCASVNVDKSICLEKTKHVMLLNETAGQEAAEQEATGQGNADLENIPEFAEDIGEEIRKNQAKSFEERRALWEAETGNCPSLTIETAKLSTKEAEYKGFAGQWEQMDPEVKELVQKLSREELIHLVCGDSGEDADEGSEIGSAGSMVPGSAGQTHGCAKKYGLASIILSDGPAGLRLTNKYYVKDGQILPMGTEVNFEEGFLNRGKEPEDAEIWYQYCTAFPIGTCLAQTWDISLMEKVGIAMGEEMKIFNCTLFLAPGMNIHRNPLCGRNFEYYSEDPMIAGKAAAAITRGVQSNEGCGTTIKHFCCNNSEDNRMGVNCRINEKALREIYLKAFEIAVKESQPLALMTSYNLVNGVHSAVNYDLCTSVLRDEWGFKGLVMTDWTTTVRGDDCTSAGCMKAGNDLVMPGLELDYQKLREGLDQGIITEDDMRLAVAHMVPAIWQSNMYED